MKKIIAAIVILTGLLLPSIFGCGGDKNKGNVLGPSSGLLNLTITPATLNIGRLGTQTFTAAGGTGTYTWTVSDANLGSIDSTGAFTAGNSIGTVTVTATDNNGVTGSATVTVSTQVVNVSPLTVPMTQGSTQTFTATGGTGTYTWSLSDNTYGNMNAASGLFTSSGATGTVLAIATDTSGNTGFGTAVISQGSITISPSTLSIPRGGARTFTALGGTGAYSWTVSDSSLGSIVLGTGVFTAGSVTGTLTVNVTDTVGNTGQAFVNITSTGLSITPSSLLVTRGGTQTFAATGGTGVYTWGISDITLGAINATTGLFTAGNTIGSLNVTVTDTAGNTGKAQISITTTGISVTPASVSITRGGTQAFAATGGTGSYTWSISDNNLGSINATTGVLIVGNNTGILSVTATDTAGNMGSATVTIVTTGINVTPSTLSIARGKTQAYTATGGTGVYAWSVSDNTLASIISTTGAFTAGNTTGTLNVIATDTAGNTGSASVAIVSTGINITPSILSIPRGGAKVFAASGGTGVYTWTLSDNNLGIINMNTGAFTAGKTFGTLSVIATDTGGNTGSASVTIIPTGINVTPNTLSVTKGQALTFQAVGGTQPYYWSSSNVAVGSININSGAFTAGNTAGFTTITVTDSVGNTGTSSVTVIAPTLIITPPQIVIPNAPAQGAQTFTTTGGSGGYAYSVTGMTGGYAGATIDPGTGILAYTVPTAAEGQQTLTITATDTLFGDTITATVQLTPAVAPTITPSVASISAAGGTQLFTAAGGSGTYTWQLTGATGGYTGATIDLTAGTTTTLTVTTLPTAIQNLVVTVTDSASATASATVTVNP